MKIRKFGTVMAAIVAVLLMTVGVAGAQDADYGEDVAFGVSVTPENPEAGDTMTGSVVGATSGETLNWTAEYNPVFASGTAMADADGNANFSFVVPAEAVGRDIVVKVTGDSGTTSSTSAEPVADGDAAEGTGDEVTAEDESDGLPLTGTDTSMLLLGGLLLLMVGGGAVVTARRKRATVDA